MAEARAHGVDIDRLIAAREPLKAGLPGEPMYGMTPGIAERLRAGSSARLTAMTFRSQASASSSSPTC